MLKAWSVERNLDWPGAATPRCGLAILDICGPVLDNPARLEADSMEGFR
jgi:hypothetical protein